MKSPLSKLACCFISSVLLRTTTTAAFVEGLRAKDFSPTSRDTTALWAASLTIYGHPGTRSPLVNWGCLELGVDFKMGDLSKNPHPFGQIPCLTDENNVVVFESGAILQYLLRNYAPTTLTQAQVATIMSWITWANASLDPICFLETPEGKVYDTGLRRPNRRLDQLNARLESQPYLVMDEFSLADVAVASYLLYVVQFFPDVDVASKWPALATYMKECASRPAYAEAFGQRVQSYVLSKLDSSSSKKLFGMF